MTSKVNLIKTEKWNPYINGLGTILFYVFMVFLMNDLFDYLLIHGLDFGDEISSPPIYQTLSFAVLCKLAFWISKIQRVVFSKPGIVAVGLKLPGFSILEKEVICSTKDNPTLTLEQKGDHHFYLEIKTTTEQPIILEKNPNLIPLKTIFDRLVSTDLKEWNHEMMINKT